MREIDITQWKRKEHFQFFHRMDYPQYNICFNLDITELLAEIKRKALPFNYSMIYLSTLSANQIEEFKYRIRDGKVVLHEIIHPSFTDMDDGDDYFKMVVVDMKSTLSDFIDTTKNKSKNQKKYFSFDELIGRDDFIYYTSIPWISFTHMSHTINLNKDDAVPRISWGRYYADDKKILLPYSVQVNHAFVDGIHIGKFKEKLEENMLKINDI